MVIRQAYVQLGLRLRLDEAQLLDRVCANTGETCTVLLRRLIRQEAERLGMNSTYNPGKNS